MQLHFPLWYGVAFSVMSDIRLNLAFCLTPGACSSHKTLGWIPHSWSAVQFSRSALLSVHGDFKHSWLINCLKILSLFLTWVLLGWLKILLLDLVIFYRCLWCLVNQSSYMPSVFGSGAYSSLRTTALTCGICPHNTISALGATVVGQSPSKAWFHRVL